MLIAHTIFVCYSLVQRESIKDRCTVTHSFLSGAHILYTGKFCYKERIIDMRMMLVKSNHFVHRMTMHSLSEGVGGQMWLPKYVGGSRSD